jgi:threonylcarbamoyladenosine tRNA methylthiotransferase MtaB
MLEVRFHTLGCKLNQLEIESIADAFQKEGFSLASCKTPPGASQEANSLFIVNTCTVTSHAEQKARRIIRKILRENPGAVLVITGCYAQMEKSALQGLFSDKVSNRVFVVPEERKAGILELPGFLKPKILQNPGSSLQAMIAEWVSCEDAFYGNGGTRGSFCFRPVDFSFHSRAFLKIQDGCNKRCAFCRTCLARGKSRSRDAEGLLVDLKALEERGYREAVLTGVNISEYQDNGHFGLTALLDFLLSGTEKIRIRLSSLEAGAIDSGFDKIMANERIRPHFHFSVQSGSPAVLDRMGRPGTLRLFEERIKLIREIRSDPFMACDIIAGFPGETADDFERTYEFCLKWDFAWIHAFPFSPRPGTAAWKFENSVPEREARARVARLTELARRGRSAYIRRWLEKETEFIPEMASGKRGITANYLKVFFRHQEPVPLDGIIRCRILREAQNCRLNPQEPDLLPYKKYEGQWFDAEAENLV